MPMNHNQQIIEMARRICRTSNRIIEMCNRERTQSGERLLSPTQCHLCEVVRQCQPVTVSELARHLGVTAPSASVMVERLVEQGFLERTTDKKDRRKRVICLTPLAAGEIAREEAGRLRPLCDLLAKAGPDKANQWLTVFSQIETEMADPIR
jgi:DNA-binding MarR family transcriptional regulator